MHDKKRGVTLLELMIVVAIIAILTGMAMLAANKRHERNEYLRMKTKIPEFFRVIADKSFEEGKSYNIYVTLPSKMEIYDGSTSPAALEEKLDLSQSLEYKMTTSDSAFNTTVTGNMNKGFRFFIFNKDEEPLYKVSLNTTRPFIRYLEVSTYKPKSTATKDNYLVNDNWTEE